MFVTSSLRDNQAARQELQKVLDNVSRLKQGVSRVDGYYQNGQRDNQDADRQLQWTQSPIMMAQQDTAQTNVSSYGWQIDNYVRTTERDLQDCERSLNSASNESYQVNSGIGDVKQGIARVRGMVADQPTVLQDLGKADTSLEGVDRNHKAADGSARWAENKNSSAERELQFSQSYIRDICNDRPGQNVSSSAMMLRSNVDRAQWDIRDVDNDLRSAHGSEQQAGTGLNSVEQALRDALQKLS